MQRRRIPSAKRKAHKGRARNPHKLDKPELDRRRFLGIWLGGGKNDRTSLVVLEYYPDQDKLFLRHIYDHIDPKSNADDALYDLILQERGQGRGRNRTSITLNVPLNWPKCIRCPLPCPGYSSCKEPEIEWMWKEYRRIQRKRKRAKVFTPYTQRCTELLLSIRQPEVPINEALGANSAPLTARAHFLRRRLKGLQFLETVPRLSVLRIGHGLKVGRSHLLHYKHQVGGEESRDVILSALMKKDLIFIYHQDVSKLLESNENFEAFFCAYTGFLKFKGACETPPRDFPLADGWIEVPKDQSL